MKPGDVVLTPLPQADQVIKNRPAVALCQMPPFGDWLVCGISTQLGGGKVGAVDSFAARSLSLRPARLCRGLPARSAHLNRLGDWGQIAPTCGTPNLV